MTTTLDTVLTIAVGRNGSDGVPMDDHTWDQFQFTVATLVGTFATVVGHGVGDGIGSDGIMDGVGEDSYIVVAVNPSDELALRAHLSDVLGRFGQSSACFSVDHFHEPCFAGTTDGFRPRVDDRYASLEADLNDGFARRTTE